MKLFFKAKDGGKESTVTGYWLIESKRLFSIVLLKFEGKSRQAYHTHAFNAISWVLKGQLKENFHITDPKFRNKIDYRPSLTPIVTPKDTFHKVDSDGTTWVLSFRGPWYKTWKEYRPLEKQMVTLTEGRKEI